MPPLHEQLLEADAAVNAAAEAASVAEGVPPLLPRRLREKTFSRGKAQPIRRPQPSSDARRPAHCGWPAFARRVVRLGMPVTAWRLVRTCDAAVPQGTTHACGGRHLELGLRPGMRDSWRRPAAAMKTAACTAGRGDASTNAAALGGVGLEQIRVASVSYRPSSCQRALLVALTSSIQRTGAHRALTAKAGCVAKHKIRAWSLLRLQASTKLGFEGGLAHWNEHLNDADADGHSFGPAPSVPRTRNLRIQRQPLRL